MSHVFTLLRRELAAYFLAPMAYLVLLAFQVIAWLNFWQLVELLALPANEFSGLRDPMNTYISGSFTFWIALLVAVPALTMRLIAEERRSGTIEGLLTLPVTEAEVVLAKWLAGVAMFWVLLLPFALYLPALRVWGRFSFDLGPLAALALGLTTLGMLFAAIGLFFSSLTRNQVVAAVGSFATMFVLIVVTSRLYESAAQSRAAWAEGLRYTAVLNHVHSLGAGQLDVRFLALHLSATVFLLFLTVKVLQLRGAR